MRRDGQKGVRSDGWMSEAASSLALAGFLSAVFVGFTVLALQPLVGLDAYFNLDVPPAGWVPVLMVLDRVGQRAVCLPVLAVVVLVCIRRQESWRPAVVAAGGVFMLNLVVLLLKLGLGRGQPGRADPSFFVGGMAYPSGHTANIILVYGLGVYLLRRYVGVRRPVRAALWTLVGGLSVLMVTVSVTLNWHWFADLVAGLLVGAVVLELTIAADAAMPRHAFDGGLVEGVRDVTASVRGRLARDEGGRAA